MNFKLFVKADDEAAAPAPEVPTDLPPPDPAAEAGMLPEVGMLPEAGMPPEVGMPPAAGMPPAFEAPKEDPIEKIKSLIKGVVDMEEGDNDLDEESKRTTESGVFNG